MAGLISKGIKLSYDSTAKDTQWKELKNLQEIPELGGETEAVEVTTLADDAHVYVDGIKNYGDSLAFKFLYDKAQFTELSKVASLCSWKVELPDATACTFKGTCSVKLDGVGVNAPLTYTLSVKPATAMAWA